MHSQIESLAPALDVDEEDTRFTVSECAEHPESVLHLQVSVKAFSLFVWHRLLKMASNQPEESCPTAVQRINTLVSV